MLSGVVGNSRGPFCVYPGKGCMAPVGPISIHARFDPFQEGSE
jgi:hypothetical protein